MTPHGEPIVVQVDPDLKDLIPGFLRNRHDDVVTLRAALERSDWETLRRLGHRLRGSGGGYGFDPITDMGESLEAAAKRQDPAAIRKATDDLATYLERIVVV